MIRGGTGALEHGSTCSVRRFNGPRNARRTESLDRQVPRSDSEFGHKTLLPLCRASKYTKFKRGGVLLYRLRFGVADQASARRVPPQVSAATDEQVKHLSEDGNGGGTVGRRRELHDVGIGEQFDQAIAVASDERSQEWPRGVYVRVSPNAVKAACYDYGKPTSCSPVEA
jgi:hypothetical protein